MSERVRERLSGAQIDCQFDSISQGGRIRTTPTPSPRSSRNLSSSVKEARSSTTTETATPTSPASPKAGPVQGNEQFDDTSVTPTPQSPSEASSGTTIKTKENRRTTTVRPPPILKQSSSGSNRPSRSSSVLFPAFQESGSAAGVGNDVAVGFDNDPTPTGPLVPRVERSARKSTTTRFNEEVAVSIPKASTVSRPSGGRLSGESSQRSGRRTPIVVASAGASRRRPPIMRQRLSQASPFAALKEPPGRTSSSPDLASSMRPTDPYTAQCPGHEAGASSARRLGAASPHPSTNRKGLSPSPPSNDGTAANFGGEHVGTQGPSMDTNAGHSLIGQIANASSESSQALVDPDFRSQFADKTRRSTQSSTNIAALARKSSAAVPTAASFQASGMLDTGLGSSTSTKNRVKDAFKIEIVPLKAPASAGPEPPAEASQPLPRTKSQLTLLLEREKNRSAGQEH